jgi:hypothetical protein
MFEKFWANIIRYYTGIVRLRGLTQNQGFPTHGGGFSLCSRASALGDFADLFAQRLPLGDATGVRFPIAKTV